MQNNRKLQISMAGSRKATHWPKSTILWSEFVDRLKTPVRGTETQEEYLAFPKARQDELKDVGGFVGGTFKGDRRKAANIEGRDLITLDLDNIPAGRTEDILKRVDGLGCAAAVYSTRNTRDTRQGFASFFRWTVRPHQMSMSRRQGNWHPSSVSSSVTQPRLRAPA